MRLAFIHGNSTNYDSYKVRLAGLYIDEYDSNSFKNSASFEDIVFQLNSPDIVVLESTIPNVTNITLVDLSLAPYDAFSVRIVKHLRESSDNLPILTYDFTVDFWDGSLVTDMMNIFRHGMLVQ